MRAKQFLPEAPIGVNKKRPARDGSRPARGHEPQPRYKTNEMDKSQTPPGRDGGDTDDGKKQHTAKPISSKEMQNRALEKLKQTLSKPENMAVLKRLKTKESVPATEAVEQDLDEKASRQLCKSSKPDSELGSSNLASCKSQGLRARDGEKSHLIGHGNSSVRITVGGKKIKGKKYGGPLPDYGTRKGQI
jgi:hypothetical protein